MIRHARGTPEKEDSSQSAAPYPAISALVVQAGAKEGVWILHTFSSPGVSFLSCRLHAQGGPRGCVSDARSRPRDSPEPATRPLHRLPTLVAFLPAGKNGGNDTRSHSGLQVVGKLRSIARGIAACPGNMSKSADGGWQQCVEPHTRRTQVTRARSGPGVRQAVESSMRHGQR